jgi:hypothetical protein
MHDEYSWLNHPDPTSTLSEKLSLFKSQLTKRTDVRSEGRGSRAFMCVERRLDWRLAGETHRVAYPILQVILLKGIILSLISYILHLLW